MERFDLQDRTRIETMNHVVPAVVVGRRCPHRAADWYENPMRRRTEDSRPYLDSERRLRDSLHKRSFVRWDHERMEQVARRASESASTAGLKWGRKSGAAAHALQDASRGWNDSRKGGTFGAQPIHSFVSDRTAKEAAVLCRK